MKAALLVSLMLLAGAGFPQSRSPAGLWQTYSDRTGEMDGLVRIAEENGELQGIVEAVFSPPAPSVNPLCEKCAGELRNKPIAGMKILRGLRWDGEQYSGGEILDPDEGRFYRCSLRVTGAGRALEVRGYVGIPLLGRTQTWKRKE